MRQVNLSSTQIRSLIEANKNHQCDPYDCCVQLVSIAHLPSQFGDFQVCGLVSPCDGKEHTAIIKGDIIEKEDQLKMRIQGLNHALKEKDETIERLQKKIEELKTIERNLNQRRNTKSPTT